jgi:hypothetical protein
MAGSQMLASPVGDVRERVENECLMLIKKNTGCSLTLCVGMASYR